MVRGRSTTQPDVLRYSLGAGEHGQGAAWRVEIRELESPGGWAPFVAVNCAAIRRDAARGGSGSGSRTGRRPACAGAAGSSSTRTKARSFDEVSDLSAAAQAKLLREIAGSSVERVGGYGARRVDIRIIVASNRSLLDLVEQKRFRLDLFYRLNGVEVQVPPLRCRRDDILELARHFLERHRGFRPLSLSTAAADALLTYGWPGNVRELSASSNAGSRWPAGRCWSSTICRPRCWAVRGRARARPPGPLDDAGVGQPVCAAGARAVREQQAEDLSRAPDFVSHAGGVLRSDKRQPIRRRERRVGEGQAGGGSSRTANGPSPAGSCTEDTT